MDLLKHNNKKILVVGDLMLDHYLWGSTERISPEAPVPVVDIKQETTVLGGAGNVINNILSLEAKVSVVSAIGDDENGLEMKAMLTHKGVNIDGIFEIPGRHTSKKTRIIATHQQMLRYDKESKNEISGKYEEKLKKHINKDLDNYDAVLLSDYGKGVLTDALTQYVIKQAKSKDIPVLVDPKGKDYSKYTGATLLTPNKKEAEIATDIKITDDASLKEAGFKLKNDFNLDISMITLSEDGIAIFNKNVTKVRAKAREVYDVTGAGDTVLATLGVGLALKLSILEAVKLANTAAAVVVGKLGSATATPEEISLYSQNISGSSIISKEEIKKVIELLKEQGKKVVFTNGCFDILHRGHVDYLQKSRNQGDILVLGLNSDASVKRLKGKERPINNQDDRAFILSGLKAVDYVVIFDEDTPYELIKEVRPDILTKGADYHGKEVVGSDIAKDVRLIEFTDGCSTTNLIQKIKE